MTVDASNKAYVSVSGTTTSCSLYTTPEETKGNYQEILLKNGNTRYLTVLETNDSLTGSVVFNNRVISASDFKDGDNFVFVRYIDSFSIHKSCGIRVSINIGLSSETVVSGKVGLRLELDNNLFYEKEIENSKLVNFSDIVIENIPAGTHTLKLYTHKSSGQIYNVKGTIFISTINKRAVDLPNVVDASIYRDGREFFIMSSANQPLQTVNKRTWSISLKKGESYRKTQIFEVEFTIVQEGTYRISSRISLYSAMSGNSWLKFYHTIDGQEVYDSGYITNRNTTGWVYLYSRDVYFKAGVHNIVLYAEAYCADGELRATINPWEVIVGSNEYAPLGGSFDQIRTWRSTWKYDWYSPPGVKVVKVTFSWHYGSDETSRLAGGKRYWASRWEPGYKFGCSIGDNQTNICWIYYDDSPTYVAVSPQTYYQLCVFVDGYKDRDYGFIVEWSSSINNSGYQINSRK